MLRISVMSDMGVTRMKFEGKLAHEWVNEAKTAWESIRDMSTDSEIIVDLLNVSFVDDAGHQLLAEMRHAGAELMASGPLMSALIDEIEEAETTTAPDVSDGH
jgi:anti-anti-sigma regulatory factor